MQILLALKFLISFLISIYLIPKLIRISNHYKIYDLPDSRKIHDLPKPFLGGVALYIAFHLTQHLNGIIGIEPPPFMELWGFTVVVNTLIGLGDDFFDFNPSRKFLIQILISGILLYFVPLQLPFATLIPLLQYIPFANQLMSILVFIGIINAFNLIDGMDGLATTLALVICAAYLLLFYIDNNLYFLSMVLSISGALIGFLLYNRPRAMIFMGDSGSFMVGTIIGIFTMVFISSKDFTHFSLGNRFQLGFSLVAIPALDMVRLFLWRIIQRKSPFVADNLHIHHLLQRYGCTVKQALALIILSQIVIFIIAVVFLGPSSFLPFLFCTIGAYLMVIIFLKNRIESKSVSADTKHDQLSA